MDEEHYSDNQLDELNKLTPEEIEKIRKDEKRALIFKRVVTLIAVLVCVTAITLLLTGYGQIAVIILIVFFAGAGASAFLAMLYIIRRLFFKNAEQSREYNREYKKRSGKRLPADGVKIKSSFFVAGFVGGAIVGAAGLYLNNIGMIAGGFAACATVFIIGIIISRF